MSETIVTRNDVIKALRDALEPLDYVYAMWEGGAASFNRLDEWSDIDLLVDAQDDRITDVVMIADEVLNRIFHVDLRYEWPQPTAHGHWQAFYHLASTSEFLLLDIVVMKHSSPNKYLQEDIHGRPVVQFDKANVTQMLPLDREDLIAELRVRLETLRVVFDLFQVLTLKELSRGNYIEALVFYHVYTLRPLVEALRIRHSPIRYNFYARYLHYDLPGHVVQCLQFLFFVKDGDDLRLKHSRAEAWFHETLAQIDLKEVAALLEKAAR
jgi:hypothetical protein